MQDAAYFHLPPQLSTSPWRGQDISINASGLRLGSSWWAVTHHLHQVDSSFLSWDLYSHLILEASSAQLPCISDWIPSQYNCDITLITVSNSSKSKDHMPIKKLAAHSYVLTTTSWCHRVFCSSLQFLVLSTQILPVFFPEPAAVKPASRLCRLALLYPLLLSFHSRQVSDLMTWSDLSVPGWVNDPHGEAYFSTLHSSWLCQRCPSPGCPPFRPPQSLLLARCLCSLGPHFLIEGHILALCQVLLCPHLRGLTHM